MSASMAVASSVFDESNRRILEELLEDGRLSLAELGRRVSLSPAAVAERLGRLERAGVIAGYRVELDPRALGFPVKAVVRVRPVMGRLHKIPEEARAIPEVTECQRITGEDCFLMTIHLRDLADLEGVLDRFAPYGQTTTSIVHSAPVPRRPLPLG
jgi:Lrp/AsnC family transcriptional regulator, leucine-responsive regulatory protein